MALTDVGKTAPCRGHLGVRGLCGRRDHGAFGMGRLGVLVGVVLERLPDSGSVVGAIRVVDDLVVVGGHVGQVGLPLHRPAGQFLASPIDRGQAQAEPSRAVLDDAGGDTGPVTVAVPRRQQMVTEPGGVPGDERVDVVQTLRRLCVEGAGVLVPLLGCGEFGRQGSAQHDDLAKIVAARLLPF